MTHRYPFSVIHPSDHYGQRVAAYFNLHYKIFSLKDRSKHGNLLSHVGVCTITNAVFDVNPKGRERAIREGRKNVHAYIIGAIQNFGWDLLSDTQVKSLLERGWKRVTYDLNPDHPEFYLKDCEEYTPVKDAKSVILSGKKAWALLQSANKDRYNMNAKDWAFAILKDLSLQGVGRQNLYKFVLFAATREDYKKEMLKKVPESMWNEVIEVMKETINN
jgi:hypothetical protein